MTKKDIKLYKHITDGGAVYLFDTYFKWENGKEKGKEGILTDKTKYIIRVDDPQLIIK